MYREPSARATSTFRYYYSFVWSLVDAKGLSNDEILKTARNDRYLTVDW